LRVNERIRVLKVLVIDDEGKKVGLMMTRDAIDLARGKGLDLVEVAPEADPPVTRIMDYGKHLYTQQKRDREARKKQVQQRLKEVKLRIKTEENDIQTKLKHIRQFLGEQDKVKLTVMYRGREMAHPELGRQLLERVLKELEELGAPEYMPKLEGRNLTTVLNPYSKAQLAAREKAKALEAKKAAAGAGGEQRPAETKNQGDVRAQNQER